MDYKKKYEDAIKRAKVINPGSKNYNIVTAIFPELKESKDDRSQRIKKEVIELLYYYHSKSPCFIPPKFSLDETLAWLEKQGERREYNPYKVTVESIVSMVEKYDYPDSDLQDFYNNIKIKCKDVIEYDKTLIKKPYEQEPANNIKPKFKAGDIIINEYGFIMQIDGIDGNMYVYHVLDGNILFKHNITKTEESCHLWSIQDAKDGNVLVTHLSPEGDWIGMYKESTGDTFKTHCYLSAVGEFVINPNRCKNHGTYGLHPATKEQRDLLFQKMKEAGYEWDDEKKELKKVEQKPNFCHHEVDLSDSSEEYRKAYYDGWNNCNQQHVQLEAEWKTAEWSKEDERIYNYALWYIRNSCGNGGKNSCEFEIYHWLKSLKQRMKGK